MLDDPLESSPGIKDIYSDLGFILLGLIVEKQNGLSLEEAVIRSVYEPLGLADKLIFKPLEKEAEALVAYPSLFNPGHETLEICQRWDKFCHDLTHAYQDLALAEVNALV